MDKSAHEKKEPKRNFSLDRSPVFRHILPAMQNNTATTAKTYTERHSADTAGLRHEKSMKPEPNSEAAETVQTKEIPEVDLPQLVSRSSVAEQFARFRASRERQHQIESRRGGPFGIAVHDDADAVEWRTHCREVEESRAFLENRKPIPECWGESSSDNA